METKKMDARPTIAKLSEFNAPSENNKTEGKEGRKTENEQIDMEMLDVISEEYINNKVEWNDITSIEVRIVELNNQLNLTTDPNVRKRIENILTTYEVQNKYLLQIEAAKRKDDKNVADTGKQSNPIVIENDETSLTTEKKKMDCTNDNKYTKITNTTINEGNTTMNIVTENEEHSKERISKNKRKSDGKTCTSPTRKPKLNNPYNKTATNKGSQMDFKSAIEAKKYNESSNTQQKYDFNIIRVRLQFTQRGGKNQNFQTQLQQLLFNIMIYAKKVTNKIALLPWVNNKSSNPLNGDEINLIKEDVLIKYIDTPTRHLHLCPTATKPSQRNTLLIGFANSV